MQLFDTRTQQAGLAANGRPGQALASRIITSLTKLTRSNKIIQARVLGVCVSELSATDVMPSAACEEPIMAKDKEAICPYCYQSRTDLKLCPMFTMLLADP